MKNKTLWFIIGPVLIIKLFVPMVFGFVQAANEKQNEMFRHEMFLCETIKVNDKSV